MSSTRSYDGGGKVSCGEKVPCGFVAVGSDGSELPELAEEIFDEIDVSCRDPCRIRAD